jgi:hypothetical protein
MRSDPTLIEFVARLHCDPAFRAEFEAQPTGAAKAFGFTGEYLSAVASRDQDEYFAAMNGGEIGHCTVCVVVACTRG